MSLLHLIILGLIQGAAELLPVSSSAHVIVAEKLLGIDPSSPGATFLLVMLHTGTLLAVIAYFWKTWKEAYFSSKARFQAAFGQIFLASLFTGIVGYGLILAVERLLGIEIEALFSNLPLIAASLAAAGALILYSGRREGLDDAPMTGSAAAKIGAVQGLCLPFRGFSRSGATISMGLLAGVGRRRSEAFSFALSVVLTPPAVARELHRLLKARAAADHPFSLIALTGPGLLGMACSFVAGLAALRLLSRALATGRWFAFGFYCLAAAAVLAAFALSGGA
jgi:undecaprenyl-diphosphatase